MQRPSRVRLGAIWLDVVWEDEAWERTSGACAQFDGKFCRIRMTDSGPSGALACRFVHEVFHACAWYIEAVKSDQIEQEAAANLAGYSLTDFWVSNPEAFAWWVGLVKEVITLDEDSREGAGVGSADGTRDA